MIEITQKATEAAAHQIREWIWAGSGLSLDREEALKVGEIVATAVLATLDHEAGEAVDLDRAAKSIADMVTAWVNGGIAMNTDWREGLFTVIKKRLARFAPPAQRSAGMPVKVKPLEWEPYPGGGQRLIEGQNQGREYLERAQHPFGAYFLMVKDGRYSTKSGYAEEGAEYSSADEAKAARQAEHDAAISSNVSTAQDDLERMRNVVERIQERVSVFRNTAPEEEAEAIVECHELERMRALLDTALQALDNYADPTSYTDSYGDQVPADAETHQGLLAKDTAATIRAALSRDASRDEERSQG